MNRMVLIVEVSFGLVVGRPRLGWMDGVKVALGSREMTVETAPQLKTGSSGVKWCICR